MITAPLATVSAWRNESARLLAVSKTPGLGPEVVEALYHASGILLASAVNATPGGPEMFATGLAALAKDVAAEQEKDLAAAARGEAGQNCPVPEPDGSARRCGCGAAGVEGCTKVAYEIGLRPDQVDTDLDAVVADDRARRDGGAV